MIELRKTVLQVKTAHLDGAEDVNPPLKLVAALAAIRNPWVGRGYVENLRPEIEAVAPELGKLRTGMILEVTGSGEAVEGYGKSPVVGLSGELEHGSTLIRTLRVGNHYREAVGAKSYLAFCNTRGGANCPITIPLMVKNDEGRRSHYLTVQASIADAPAPDEIFVTFGAPTSGRPHHRIGDRYQDLKEMGRDVANPAGV